MGYQIVRNIVAREHRHVKDGNGSFSIANLALPLGLRPQARFGAQPGEAWLLARR